LWTLYPENPEYAIRAADVQIRAGKANDALKTIELLASSPIPLARIHVWTLRKPKLLNRSPTFRKRNKPHCVQPTAQRAKGSRLLEAEALWRAWWCDDFPRRSAAPEPGGLPAIHRSRQTVGDLLLVARAFTILGLIAARRAIRTESVTAPPSL